MKKMKKCEEGKNRKKKSRIEFKKKILSFNREKGKKEKKNYILYTNDFLIFVKRILTRENINHRVLSSVDAVV